MIFLVLAWLPKRSIFGRKRTYVLHFLPYGFGYGLQPKAKFFHGRTFGYGRRWKLCLRSNTAIIKSSKFWVFCPFLQRSLAYSNVAFYKNFWPHCDSGSSSDYRNGYARLSTSSWLNRPNVQEASSISRWLIYQLGHTRCHSGFIWLKPANN